MKQRHKLLISSLLIITTFLAVILITTTSLRITGNVIFSSQPDPTLGKDTYIRQDSATNYGLDPVLKIGTASTAGGKELKSILKFNVSSIPQTDTIINATLQLYLTYPSTSNTVTINAYPATSDSEELEANWLNLSATTAWNSQGGDYGPLISSTDTSTTGWYTFDLTSIVREWVNDGRANYGIFLYSPTSAVGDLKEFASSDYTDNTALRPKLTINHAANAPPTILQTTTDSSPASPKQVDGTLTFSINWTDLESNDAKIYICNSSDIDDQTGCGQKTFCSSILSSENPIVCGYIIQQSDNKTTSFWTKICDYNNCSDVSPENFFYTNHAPSITIINPNGGETVNQSKGNYSIIFNVSDPDYNDQLKATIYYGKSINSTDNLIESNITLSTICNDPDSNTATTNTCNYSWDSTGIYGTFYLTIIINDSSKTSQDSSDSSFQVRSIIDLIAPNLSTQSISQDIFSGKMVKINATITDENQIIAWANLNNSQTNYSMTNITPTTFQTTFQAGSPGQYQYKTYARDIVGNLNDSAQWQTFTIRAPKATTSNEQYPTTSLPFHTIKITGDIKAIDNLTNISATLNAPSGFTFISNYPQNNQLNNIIENQTKSAEWYLSCPLTENTYTLNITYTDQYLNSWQSQNFQIQVTSSIGGGYDLSVYGYPEVEATGTYYTESTFKQNGQPTNPDSITISLYDPAKNPILTNTMTQKSTGVYNYSYSVGSAPMGGQWQTIINATKSGTSYYTSEFWKVVGALFDVKNITIIDPSTTKMNISVILENIGNNPTDLFLQWNLTREDNSEVLDTGFDTIGVGSTPITHYISPTTTYIGQTRITFIGTYSDTEKAASYKTFTTTKGEETSPTTPSSGGGGGGSSTTETQPENEYDLEITNLEETILLTKNIEKTIPIKIKNTGTGKLTNIKLTIENLDNKKYTIFPETIKTLDPQETKEFEARIIISDILGEKSASIKITSDQTNEQQPITLKIVLIEEYFQEELGRLSDKLDLLQEKFLENNLSSLFQESKNCEEIKKNLEDEINKEEFIKAQDGIKELEECIKKVEDKSNLNEIPFTNIKMQDYWIWIITWTLILILILIILIMLHLIHKKLNILTFAKQKAPTNKNQLQPQSKTLIDEKLKKIKEQLE